MPTTVYSSGLVYLSACTDESDEAATASVNLQHPSGVTPWHVANETFASGEPNGVQCHDDPSKRHLLFSC